MEGSGVVSYLTVIGGLFVVWFFLVALFAPGIDYKLRTRLDTASREFLHTLQTTCQAALHRNNRFEILTNASQFYPAMLAAIRDAQRSIDLACYIFKTDDTGRRFMSALSERARSGVVVDAIGSFRFGFSAVRTLRRAGCRVELYQRFKWYRLARLNNRTHREILVVDGAVAFVGGAGIGDAWAKGKKDGRPWRVVWRGIFSATSNRAMKSPWTAPFHGKVDRTGGLDPGTPAMRAMAWILTLDPADASMCPI